MDIETTSTVKSAVRVLMLFELLGNWREMSHSEIAKELDIPKSSLSQLLKALVARQWIAYLPGSKGYALGPAFSRIAGHVQQGKDLASIAGAALEQLTVSTSESSAVNVLRGDMAVVTATVLGPQRLVSHMRLGDVAPLYATSGGKAILAFLPQSMQDDYFSKVKFEAATASTIQSVRTLRAQLQEIRDTGVAFSFQEWTPGIVGIGRPIVSDSGEVLGALNVAMPSVRYTDETRALTIEALAKAAELIHHKLTSD
jgi:DNA-binding IclR family transcriptional regulator